MICMHSVRPLLEMEKGQEAGKTLKLDKATWDTQITQATRTIDTCNWTLLLLTRLPLPESHTWVHRSFTLELCPLLQMGEQEQLPMTLHLSLTKGGQRVSRN
jgi:hypothetical protein